MTTNYSMMTSSCIGCCTHFMTMSSHCVICRHRHRLVRTSPYWCDFCLWLIWQIRVHFKSEKLQCSIKWNWRVKISSLLRADGILLCKAFTVEDPGFSSRGANPKRGTNLLCGQFSWKLHENIRNWTERRRVLLAICYPPTLARPMIWTISNRMRIAHSLTVSHSIRWGVAGDGGWTEGSAQCPKMQKARPGCRHPSPDADPRQRHSGQRVSFIAAWLLNLLRLVRAVQQT